MNAIKYAFPTARASARIRVTFEKANADWKLTVSDNGVGRAPSKAPKTSTGLGTALIGALAKQLNAQITEPVAARGLTIEVTRSTFEITFAGRSLVSGGRRRGSHLARADPFHEVGLEVRVGAFEIPRHGLFSAIGRLCSN